MSEPIKMESVADKFPQPTPDLTLGDLLKAESEVLRRIGQNTTERQSSGHYSNTSGHNSSGSHSSHTSAKAERPLES
jgi:hypothetical protein